MVWCELILDLFEKIETKMYFNCELEDQNESKIARYLYTSVRPSYPLFLGSLL